MIWALHQQRQRPDMIGQATFAVVISSYNYRDYVIEAVQSVLVHGSKSHKA